MTDLVTAPYIVSDNGDSLSGVASTVLDELLSRIGPTEMGQRLFGGVNAENAPPKVQRHYAYLARRLSSELYSYAYGQSVHGEWPRSLVAAYMGMKVSSVTAADMETHGTGEGECWLLDDLEPIGQDLAGPGLAFGPIPDDGSYAWYWSPDDDDIIIDETGRAWAYAGVEIEGGPAAIPAWCESEQFWPNVWRDGHYGPDGPPIAVADLTTGADRTYAVGDHVNRGDGLAYRVTRLPWSGAPSEYGVTAVGDDVEDRADAADLGPLVEDDYCAQCGQLGCTADGRS
jgi:hypothetical protein